MPRPRRAQTDIADALAAVAPLATRWMERVLARHDTPLTVPQYLALRAIGREDISGADLARRAGVSGPAVSQLLAGLAEGGLVDRRPAAADRRRQELSLSAAGKAVLSSAESVLRARLGELVAHLPPQEVDALARLLPRLEAVLSGAPPPRRPPPRTHRGRPLPPKPP
jgi:DNA-binding MarR family transcriptional regulator